MLASERPSRLALRRRFQLSKIGGASFFMKASDKKLFLAVMDTLEPIEKACLLLTIIGNMSFQEIVDLVTKWPRHRMAVSRIISTAKKKARKLKDV